MIVQREVITEPILGVLVITEEGCEYTLIRADGQRVPIGDATKLYWLIARAIDDGVVE